MQENKIKARETELASIASFPLKRSILAYITKCLRLVSLFFCMFTIFIFQFMNNGIITWSLSYRFAFVQQKILSALNDFLKSFLMSSGVQYVGSCEHHMYQSTDY